MRKLAATLAVVEALLFSAGSAWADFDDGLEAFERGDYETATREYRPLAEKGDAMAQTMLGWMYDNGEGVPEKDAEAAKWYLKAAEQGNAVAQLNLGGLYNMGEGVPQNNAEYDRLKNKKNDTASTTKPDTASSGDDPLESKLEKLQKLLEKGLVTEEEAAAKRAILLEDF